MENLTDHSIGADKDSAVSKESAVDLKEEEDEVDSEEGSDEEEDEEEGDEEGSGEEDEENEDEEDDDEEDDDEEEDGNEEEDMEEGDSQLDVSQESDSDGEDLPTCPICLDKLRSQDIGTPESCDHQFCMQCIVEWSRNINTCPVDRQPFNIVLARHPGEDKVFKRISVEDHQMSDEEVLPEEEEDITECEVCHESDQEDRLLLCDGCDLAYHCECLTPPLATVPVEEWFCPTCAEVNNGVAAAAARAAEEAEDDDMMRLPRRQIARTRVSERVRQRIQVLRMRQRRLLDSSDEDEMDISEDMTPTISTSTSRASSTSRRTTRRKTSKRRKTKRRKTARKRKTPTKAKTGTATGKKTTRRKGRKRKARRKKKTTRKRKVTPAIPHRPGFSITSQAFSAPMSRTIKGRIAERLGLSKPPPGRTIPMQRRPGERPVDIRRGDYGTAPLSILGDTNELIAFPDVEDDSPQVLPAARAASTVVLSRPPVAIQCAVKKPIPVSRITSYAPASFDLLSSIFKDQSMLHMNSSDIHINRDGSLKATKPVKVRSFEKPPSPVPRAARIADLVALESVSSRNEPSDTGENPNNSGSSAEGGNSGSGEDNPASGDSGSNGYGDNSEHSGDGAGDGGAGEDTGGSNGGSGDGSDGGGGDDDDRREDSPDKNEEAEEENSEEEQQPQEEDEMGSTPVEDEQEDYGEDQALEESEKIDSLADKGAEDEGSIQNTEENQSAFLSNTNSEGNMQLEMQSSAGSSMQPKASTASEMEDGELSKSSSVTPVSSATSLQEANTVQTDPPQGTQNQGNNSGGAADGSVVATTRRRERRKNRWSDIVKEDEVTGAEDEEVKMPQEVTTPFSLASFLSHVGQEEMQTGGVEGPATSSQEAEEEREFTYINGTFARVDKKRVDEKDLDRRLDDIYKQRRVERGLLRMYGMNDHEDGSGEGPEGAATGGDSNTTKDGDGKDKTRDGDDKPREGRRRSRSRDRDRDRRRSRSREKRRSRSRDRRRSRSRSRDKTSRRPRESGGEDIAAGGRGRDDRSGRDKDRFGRDRRDQDRSGRDRDDKKDPTKERSKRSRSPRDRRGDNRDGRDFNRDRQPDKEEDDRFTKAGWRTGGGGRGGRDGGGWGRDRGGRGGGRDRDGGGRGRFSGGRQSDWSEGKGEGNFGQNQGPKYGWNDQDGGRGVDGGRGWNNPEQMSGVGAGRGWNDQEKHGAGAGGRGGGQGWNHKRDQPAPGGGVGGGAGFMGAQDFFSHQQNQFQQPPPSLLPQELPFGQQPPFRGNQPPGLFNQPPPSLDPFASTGPVPVPPPPQAGAQLPPPGGFQPWLGTNFQQQQGLPTNQQTLPTSQQAPPPPPGMMGDYSQPPPPLPNLLNNGDFDTLKKSLLLLTGGSDPNTPVSGSPGLVGASQQGLGSLGNVSDVSASVPPPPALGERHSGFGGSGGESRVMETTSGNGEGDAMELELPSGSKDDFQDRVVEEVKTAIRPHFNSRHISKDEYKEILKKCVPKVCNSGEINSKKISNLVSAYVKKMRAARAK